MTINIKGYDVFIDDDVAGMVLARKWHISDRKRGICFATSIKYPDGKIRDVKLHRFIMEAPPGFLVDHRDGNHLNCMRYNLRVCNTAQNSRNVAITKRNTSGFKGVSRRNKKYRAQICYNGKSIHLGLFDTPEQAAAEYDKKARELFGEYYREESKEA
jgi:hypothetical protein